jgi:holliday junction DNA helicase RuvA
VIAYLRGRHMATLPNGAAIVDVAGVGYEVQVAHNLDAAEVELFVYTVVRDDAFVLFGFLSLDDRAFFELLLSVPGVGPSTALGALRTLGRDELIAAVLREDVKAVAKAPGIGAKTAQRIVLELADKVSRVRGDTASSERNDTVMEALTALGYTQSEIRSALRDVEFPDDEVEALRMALGLLGRA